MKTINTKTLNNFIIKLFVNYIMKLQEPLTDPYLKMNGLGPE